MRKEKKKKKNRHNPYETHNLTVPSNIHSIKAGTCISYKYDIYSHTCREITQHSQEKVINLGRRVNLGNLDNKLKLQKPQTRRHLKLKHQSIYI